MIALRKRPEPLAVVGLGDYEVRPQRKHRKPCRNHQPHPTCRYAPKANPPADRYRETIPGNREREVTPVIDGPESTEHDRHTNRNRRQETPEHHPLRSAAPGVPKRTQGRER